MPTLEIWFFCGFGCNLSLSLYVSNERQHTSTISTQNHGFLGEKYKAPAVTTF